MRNKKIIVTIIMVIGYICFAKLYGEYSESGMLKIQGTRQEIESPKEITEQQKEETVGTGSGAISVFSKEKENKVILSGLLFTGRTLPNSKTLELLEGIELLSNEFKQLSLDELKKKLKDKDYTVRIIALMHLLFKTKGEPHYQVVFPEDKGWEPYIEKLLIDLENATEREKYINIEADIIEKILIQIGELAIPMLEKEINKTNKNERYRRWIIYTLSGMAENKPVQKDRVKRILQNTLENSNTQIRERAKREIKRLEEKKGLSIH